MKSLLEDLREKTGTIHRELHTNPILLACQEKRMNKSEYLHMLKSFYSPWQKIIPSIDTLSISALKPFLITRYQLLKDDLLNLGVREDFFNIKKGVDSTEAEILGISYVVLGSSMGAKQLRVSVLNTLPNVPVKYLSNTPKDSGWFLLLNELKNITTDGYEKSTISAVEAFESIKRELSKPLILNASNNF